MANVEASPGLWFRLAKAARLRTDRERGAYVAFRRLAAPVASAARTLTAKRLRARPDLVIPKNGGFLLVQPGAFPETTEIVELARETYSAVDLEQVRFKHKDFMLPIVDPAMLTSESPLLRFATREDVLSSVSSYLGVVPLLTSINIYLSQSVTGDWKSSQLFHCDGDDTRQVKIFVLCSAVDEHNGPLMILDAEQSGRLRKRLKYQYRNRVKDEKARKVLGGEPRLDAVVGEPGTTCFVDTSRCFHYGSRVESDAEPRLVAVFQYLTPYSFMLPRNVRSEAPFRHLARPGAGRLEQLVLGVS